MRQCAAHERWAGLWDFPRFAVEAEGPLFAAEEIVTKLRQQTGITCRTPALLKTIRHGVTRFRITLDCYGASFVSGRTSTSQDLVIRWIERSKLNDLPLSTTGRRIARAMVLGES
jgi:A/G-specific adenine glycosylase